MTGAAAQTTCQLTDVPCRAFDLLCGRSIMTDAIAQSATLPPTRLVRLVVRLRRWLMLTTSAAVAACIPQQCTSPSDLAAAAAAGQAICAQAGAAPSGSISSAVASATQSNCALHSPTWFGPCAHPRTAEAASAASSAQSAGSSIASSVSSVASSLSNAPSSVRSAASSANAAAVSSAVTSPRVRPHHCAILVKADRLNRAAPRRPRLALRAFLVPSRLPLWLFKLSLTLGEGVGLGLSVNAHF